MCQTTDRPDPRFQVQKRVPEASALYQPTANKCSFAIDLYGYGKRCGQFNHHHLAPDVTLFYDVISNRILIYGNIHNCAAFSIQM